MFKGFVAEEGFIATTIMLSPYRDWIHFDENGKSHSLTYIKSFQNNHPTELGELDIHEAELSGLFFARKVNPTSSISFIDYFMNR